MFAAVAGVCLDCHCPPPLFFLPNACMLHQTFAELANSRPTSRAEADPLGLGANRKNTRSAEEQEAFDTEMGRHLEESISRWDTRRKQAEEEEERRRASEEDEAN